MPKEAVMFNTNKNNFETKVSTTPKQNLIHMSYAMAEMGQHEIKGVIDNERIVEYFDATELNATNDETPWCSAFVNFILREAGVAGTNSAMALSFKNWGKRTVKPAYGDIVLFNHGSGRGHVGFFVSASKGKVAVLGGNQNDSVNITHFDANSVYQYRSPLKPWNSTTIAAASISGGISVGGIAAGLSNLSTGAFVMQVDPSGTGGAANQVLDGINVLLPYLSPNMQTIVAGVVGLCSAAYVFYKRLKVIASQQR